MNSLDNGNMLDTVDRKNNSVNAQSHRVEGIFKHVKKRAFALLLATSLLATPVAASEICDQSFVDIEQFKKSPTTYPHINKRDKIAQIITGSDVDTLFFQDAFGNDRITARGLLLMSEDELDEILEFFDKNGIDTIAKLNNNYFNKKIEFLKFIQSHAQMKCLRDSIDPNGGLNTDKPTDPVDQPTDPVDQPTDPVDQPTDPVDQPTDPIDQPTDPIDQPTDPVDQPTDPVDQPTESFCPNSVGIEPQINDNGDFEGYKFIVHINLDGISKKIIFKDVQIEVLGGADWDGDGQLDENTARYKITSTASPSQFANCTQAMTAHEINEEAIIVLKGKDGTEYAVKARDLMIFRGMDDPTQFVIGSPSQGVIAQPIDITTVD